MSSDHERASREQVESIGIPPPGVEPAFLPHPLLDRLLEAIVVLGGELWIERDRRKALESLLQSRGLIEPEEIEAHVGGDSDARQQELSALVHRLLNPLRSMSDGE